MKDWDTNHEMIQDGVLKRGDSVSEASHLYAYELDWAKEHKTRWYRSKNSAATGYSAYSSYLLNKKWTLEEEFNKHLLKFQQVTVSSIYFSKLHFYIPG